MSRPCVCEGSNENCRYCGGRGEIPDTLGDALAVHGRSPHKLVGGEKTEREQQMEREVTNRELEMELPRFMAGLSRRLRRRLRR